MKESHLVRLTALKSPMLPFKLVKSLRAGNHEMAKHWCCLGVEFKANEFWTGDEADLDCFISANVAIQLMDRRLAAISAIFQLDLTMMRPLPDAQRILTMSSTHKLGFTMNLPIDPASADWCPHFGSTPSL